jgi:hypothetical protein
MSGRYSSLATIVLKGRAALNITGGTVQNTNTTNDGRAIYSSSSGTINISGSSTQVLATEGYNARAIIRSNSTRGNVIYSGITVDNTSSSQIRNVGTNYASNDANAFLN